MWRTTKGENVGRLLRICAACLRKDDWHVFGLVERQPILGEVVLAEGAAGPQAMPLRGLVTAPVDVSNEALWARVGVGDAVECCEVGDPAQRVDGVVEGAGVDGRLWVRVGPGEQAVAIVAPATHTLLRHVGTRMVPGYEPPGPKAKRKDYPF